MPNPDGTGRPAPAPTPIARLSSRTATLAPAFALALAASLLGSGWSTGDDTYIYMNYARSLFDGQGYAYNGTVSTGVTSLAWLVLAGGLCKLLGLRVIGWKLAGALAFASAYVGMLSIRRLPPLLAAVLLLNPLTLRWSASGMENALTLLFITALFGCYLSPRETTRARVALLAPISLFVRPELALLSAALLALLATEGESLPGALRRMLAPALAGLGLFLAMALAFHFQVIPQTAAAKGIFLAMPDRWYAAAALARILLVSGALVVLCALPASGTPDRAVRLLRLSALCAAILCGYLAHRNILISTRYETSIAFPMLLAACLVLAGPSRLPRRARAAAWVQIVLSLGLFLFFLPVKRSDEGVAIGDFAARAREIVIRAEGGPKTVALSEVGAFGYYSGLPIADTIGLVSGQAMDFYRATGSRPCDTLDTLEAFLARFSIHYYVETFGADRPITGKRLRFTPLLETTVTRNNMTQFTPDRDRWRLYRVDFDTQR